MIALTRIRHSERFYLNPDLFERVDTHVDTVIRLVDGTEYVVVESGAEIARRIIEYRAQIFAVAALLQSGTYPTTADEPVDTTDGDGDDRPPAELDARPDDLVAAGAASSHDVPTDGDTP